MTRDEIRAMAAAALAEKRRKGVPRRSEHDEQVLLVAALRAARILFTAPANGVRTTPAQAGKAKAAGLERGCPDLLIFEQPPALVDVGQHACGVAIEMKAPSRRPKTARAGRYSGAEPHQRRYLECLRHRGWLVAVHYSAAEAIAWLRRLGFEL